MMIAQFVITFIVVLIVLIIVYLWISPASDLTREQIKTERFYLGIGLFLVLVVAFVGIIGANKYANQKKSPTPAIKVIKTSSFMNTPPSEKESVRDIKTSLVSQKGDEKSVVLEEEEEKPVQMEDPFEETTPSEKSERIEDIVEQHTGGLLDLEAQEKVKLAKDRENYLPQCLTKRLIEKRDQSIKKHNSRWKAVKIFLKSLPPDLQTLVTKFWFQSSTVQLDNSEELFFVQPEIDGLTSLPQILKVLSDAFRDQIEATILVNWNTFEDGNQVATLIDLTIWQTYLHFWSKLLLRKFSKENIIRALFQHCMHEFKQVQGTEVNKHPYKLNGKESCDYLIDMLDNTIRYQFLARMSGWMRLYGGYITIDTAQQGRELWRDSVTKKYLQTYWTDFNSKDPNLPLYRHGYAIDTFEFILFTIELPEPIEPLNTNELRKLLKL